MANEKFLALGRQYSTSDVTYEPLGSVSEVQEKIARWMASAEGFRAPVTQHERAAADLMRAFGVEGDEQ